MGIYLYPLFTDHLYVPVYDNLDSNVVWEKILAHSGKIFAPNDAIIPNMMNGLPRASYGSEFSLILWLYYFFDAKTAFVINEVLIHIIAFVGAYLMLSRYIVPQNRYYSYSIIFAGSIYFATLPFWSGAGISISSLPLTTYVLLNIKNRIDTKLDWLYLILLPLYSSLILVYMFYIVFAGIYWVYTSLRQHKIDWRLFGAISLLGVVFLLTKYRLVYAMFIDPAFVSHRIEFDMFFKEDLWECYRLVLVKFLQGHIPHASSLQQLYILPISIIALIIGLINHRLTKRDAMIIWLIILCSFAFDIWNTLLVNRYSIPVILFLSFLLYYKKSKYTKLGLLFVFIILVDIIATSFQYEGFRWVTEYLPILKSLNMVRFHFFIPLIFLILYSYSLEVYFKKLSYGPMFVLVLTLTQFTFAIEQSFYQSKHDSQHLSFDEYYSPKIFDQLKQDIQNKYHKPINGFRFVSYGIEPAVALYNGLYTVDGYNTNYPLSYKKSFRETQTKVLTSPLLKTTSKLFDNWGSKLYLVGINSTPETYNLYKKANMDIPYTRFNADTKELCRLGTSFVLSSYPLKNSKEKNLIFIKNYQDKFWSIWLYKTKCNQYSF
jgi:hypothetical protein